MRCTKQKSHQGKIKILREKYLQLQSQDQANCRFIKINKEL